MNGQQHYKEAERLIRRLEQTANEAMARGLTAEAMMAAVEIQKALLIGHVGLAQVAATLDPRAVASWSGDDL